MNLYRATDSEPNRITMPNRTVFSTPPPAPNNAFEPEPDAEAKAGFWDALRRMSEADPNLVINAALLDQIEKSTAGSALSAMRRDQLPADQARRATLTRYFGL